MISVPQQPQAPSQSLRAPATALSDFFSEPSDFFFSLYFYFYLFIYLFFFDQPNISSTITILPKKSIEREIDCYVLEIS